jgi:hypothetical protein
MTVHQEIALELERIAAKMHKLEETDKAIELLTAAQASLMALSEPKVDYGWLEEEFSKAWEAQ